MSERTAVFIDGSNHHAMCRSLGTDTDFKKLKKFFEDRDQLVRIYYLTSIIEAEFISIRPLVDWLDYNGFTVITKAAKTFTDSNGIQRSRTSMDVEIACAALELAYTGTVDKISIMSGDGDLAPLVRSLKTRGVRTEVISSIQTTPMFTADELRRAADVFTEFALLAPLVGRDREVMPVQTAEPDVVVVRKTSRFAR